MIRRLLFAVDVAAVVILCLVLVSCAREPLTLKAYPRFLVNPQEVHFVARYDGDKQPVWVEWHLCHVNSAGAVDLSATRPLMLEADDFCKPGDWPMVRLRDAQGLEILTAHTQEPLSGGRE